MRGRDRGGSPSDDAARKVFPCGPAVASRRVLVPSTAIGCGRRSRVGAGTERGTSRASEPCARASRARRAARERAVQDGPPESARARRWEALASLPPPAQATASAEVQVPPPCRRRRSAVCPTCHASPADRVASPRMPFVLQIVCRPRDPGSDCSPRAPRSSPRQPARGRDGVPEGRARGSRGAPGLEAGRPRGRPSSAPRDRRTRTILTAGSHGLGASGRRSS